MLHVNVIFATFVGVVDYLTTEISTSKQKRFSLVTFVDTPGLVDGDMKYAFDVDDSILWLGELRRQLCFNPLSGGGGPQIGEVTCGGSPHLSCKHELIIKMRDYIDRQVTPSKHITSPTWGPPPRVLDKSCWPAKSSH